MTVRKIAVIGGGPIGLEAALRARREGHEVLLFEAGHVAEHFARYGPVRLFTPFRMNSTELGRGCLRAAGVQVPDPEEILTAAELRRRYLLPLAALPDLRGVLREGMRVVGIAREGSTKARSARSDHPFVLRIENARGESAGLEHADVVIDASGVYAQPNATGPGGLAASGEDALGMRLERHLPDIRGEARARYAGKRILLVGDGRSVSNALADLDDVVREGGVGARTRVELVHRERGRDVLSPVPRGELDQLPELRRLQERAGRIARESEWIRRHAGATIAAYRTMPSGAIEATLVDDQGRETRLEVDRVLALVGYRPDLALFRELQIHLCYATEGPMALASALLAARDADPEASKGCLGEVAHGPETLRNPEPDFYVLGVKSYGRRSNFILAVGHGQIEDVMTLIGTAEPRGAEGVPGAVDPSVNLAPG
jgi:thioredoxin reductase